MPLELIKNRLFVNLIALPLKRDQERLSRQETLLQAVKIVEIVPQQGLIVYDFGVQCCD